MEKRNKTKGLVSLLKGRERYLEFNDSVRHKN